MNRLLKHTGISLLFITFFISSCASTYAPAGYDDQYGSSYGGGPQVQVSGSISFYDELSPYGRWVSYPGYDRVWIPNAGRDFRPYYTNGHWVYTDYGWTWMSDYSWGWAAFHYGRWLYDDFQGWMWVPGNDWGPAWVSWRTGGDYYGWAPMGPQYSYNAPASYWAFVPRQYINSPRINNYYVNNSRNVTIINNTTVINNTNNYGGNRVYAGPSAREVQRYSGQTIRPSRIENASRPGTGRVENDRVQIYRPDAAAIQRGREADRTRPVQPIDNSNNNNRPGRVTPGGTTQPVTNPVNNGGSRVRPGEGNQPVNNNNNGTLPGNNGGRVRPGTTVPNQPVNNNPGNNDGGRVRQGTTQPQNPTNNNNPGSFNRPSRGTAEQQQQLQQQQQRIQQQQQQRVQQEQQQQQQRVQQEQQQQRVQQQQQQQRVQQQQQQQQRMQQQQQQQRVQQQQQQQQRVQQQQQQQQRQQQQQQQRQQQQPRPAEQPRQQQGQGERPSRVG